MNRSSCALGNPRSCPARARCDVPVCSGARRRLLRWRSPSFDGRYRSAARAATDSVTVVTRGGTSGVLPFRRKRSFKRRLTDAFRKAPKRGRKLRAAAAELDVPWARSAPARFVRERYDAVRAQPGDGLLRRPAGHRQGEAVGAQRAGDPGRQPRQPHGHAGDPLGAAAQAAQAHGGRRRRRLLLPQQADRVARLAGLQHRADRTPQGRRCQRHQEHEPPRHAARRRLEPAAVSRGNALTRWRARTGPPRRRGPGGRAQPRDHPDQGHRHRRRDATRPPTGPNACVAGCSHAVTGSPCRSASRSSPAATPTR